jgi:hypothetical protein
MMPENPTDANIKAAIMEIAPADALVAALMNGKSLVKVEHRLKHLEEPLEVYLYKWSNGEGQSLRLRGWGSALAHKADVALSIIESPWEWRLK